MNDINAVIEVGSNSVKLLVAKNIFPSKIKTIIYTREITRLGKDVKRCGFLKIGSIDKTLKAIENFIKMAKDKGSCKILGIGTYALRVANNSKDFINRAKSLGLDINILSGKEEALYTRKGAIEDIENDIKNYTVVIDIGGGSSEFVYKNFIRSFSLGALSLSENYFKRDPPLQSQKIKASFEVNEIIQKGLSSLKIGKINLVGVGGTIFSVASFVMNLLKYSPNKIHLSKINIDKIEEMLNILSSVNVDKRRSFLPFDPQRADSIIGGLIILKGFLEYLNIKEMTVSVKNIIHGYYSITFF